MVWRFTSISIVYSQDFWSSYGSNATSPRQLTGRVQITFDVRNAFPALVVMVVNGSVLLRTTEATGLESTISAFDSSIIDSARDVVPLFKLNSSTLYLSLRDWFQAGSMHIAFCHPQLDAKPDTTQHHITSHQATHPLHSHPYVTKPNNQTNLPHTTNALLIPPPSHNKSQAPSRQPITLDH